MIVWTKGTLYLKACTYKNAWYIKEIYTDFGMHTSYRQCMGIARNEPERERLGSCVRILSVL